jgi:hypothetical protein
MSRFVCQPLAKHHDRLSFRCGGLRATEGEWLSVGDLGAVQGQDLEYAVVRNKLKEERLRGDAGRLSAGILNDIRSQMAAKFPTFTLRLVPEAKQAVTDG